MNANQEEKKMFSVEEINRLNEKTSEKKLKDFFYRIFLKHGDSEEEAMETAKRWAFEMTKNDPPKK